MSIAAAQTQPMTRLGKAGFPGKPKRTHTPLDLDGIQKCRDPYKPDRAIADRKYDELFGAAKEGDCFRVPGGTKELSAFARAARMHFQRHGQQAIVRQQSRTDDGIQRVWILKILNKPTSKSC
jgi:hypothetical protein